MCGKTDVQLKISAITILGVRQFLVTERSLKMMKNVFCFILKALFFLNILNFCLDYLVM